MKEKEVLSVVMMVERKVGTCCSMREWSSRRREVERRSDFGVASSSDAASIIARPVWALSVERAS